MFDKNALRLAYRGTFAAAVARYRQRLPLAEGTGLDLSACTLRPCRPGGIIVCVRKRPIFEDEVARGDFDGVTVLPGEPLPVKVVLHNCLFLCDLKTPLINHAQFEFDHVFGESAKNHEVYRLAASELVASSREGGTGTIFMFGQTGSGKTHTMSAIEAAAARDLFEGADGRRPWVAVQFVEVRGSRCYDLLATSGDAAPELRLREHSEGLYSAEGATLHFPESPEELQAMLRAAHARRATSATEANATSSRSHAVCTVRMLRSKGELTLADCAGTERKKDSMHHSQARRQEGAEINASLYALKECIRHAATGRGVPPHAYRASALTKLLSGAFARGGSRLAAICTVSPCASDAEHTLETLRTGARLRSNGSEQEERELLAGQILELRPREAHPKQWAPAQVRAWFAEAAGGCFRDVGEALPADFTGQMLVRLTEGRCAQLCGSERRGHQLFELLHQEIRRLEGARRRAPTAPPAA